MREFDYDILVIGSGPAGHRAAIQAAKLKKRVAVVERKAVLGGAWLNTGTIPSKTLREAVVRLSGYLDRGMYGASYTVKKSITMNDLLFRVGHVLASELDIARHQLARNGVEVLMASASFTGPHSVMLEFLDDQAKKEVTAHNIVIATGTTTTRDPHIPFDGERIFISDETLKLKRLPRTLAVVGAGVIGLEYASIFAALGVRVTIIDKRNELLTFVDREIMDSLVYHLRQHRATLWLGEEVSGIEPFEDEHGPKVRILLGSSKRIVAEKALYSIGRTGATDALNLSAAGLAADDRKRLVVNKHYQTSVPHIYAAGDVIGFPSLASTSMEQGRLAVCHANGVEAKCMPELFPYGIYTIPEISMVGKTEQDLTQEGVPYEVGKAHYKETARGNILGDRSGLLKILFHLDTRNLLGVHIIGETASELIHIGQAVLALDAPVDYFVNTVFNYPTLAECYKTAAFDVINRID